MIMHNIIHTLFGTDCLEALINADNPEISVAKGLINV
jgi:hypothetical protein